MPNKVALKKSVIRRQSKKCALTGNTLPTASLSLVDTDRINPKADGGTYTSINTRIVDPVAHLERHGNLRIREEALEHLKSVFDDRVQMMKLDLKLNNQLLAYRRRTDHVNEATASFIEEQKKPLHARLKEIDRELTKIVMAFPDPLVQTALRVKGIGPITVAALTVYVDISKAANASSLWKYVGLHCASKDRYQKGVKGGGNKTLRTVLYNTALVMMKMRTSPYREVYDRVKLRLSQSQKLVESRNTEGKLVTVEWQNAKPCHRNGAALRAVMKHVLADYWFVGRTLAGLDTTAPYVQAQLGHTHIVSPSERGWEF